jgi:hypothetical protein
MRFEPPVLDSPTRGQPEEDLDGLLRAFFRSEMPEPWPTMPVPEVAPVLPMKPRAMPSRRPLFRSRLALAASVALFLLGSWLLSGSFSQLTNDGPSPVSPSAKKHNHFKVRYEVRDGVTHVIIDGKSADEDMEDVLPMP